jgi:hypothetical protein
VTDQFSILFFHVKPEKISLFRFLLEGYDGLAVLSTVDAKQGLVRLLVPGSRLKELRQLLAAIAADLGMSDAEEINLSNI